ncbi:MAG: ribosomal protein L7/L12 [Acidobacteria bacterium]|nr:ribosomal protein L7/L12 [Acidobacteriota bacterium]
MPISLKCPTCNAPLEITDASQQIDVCEFCGNRILLSPSVHQEEHSEPFPGGLLEQARNLKRIKELARSGNKIEAIKLFRETFGVGLKEAKDAVEMLDAGKPVVFTQTSSVTTASPFFTAESRPAAPYQVTVRQNVNSGFSIGRLFARLIGVFAIFAITAGIIIWFATDRVSKSIRDVVRIAGTSQGAEKGPDGLLTEALRFGGEGIGAGKFKDNRTVALDSRGNVYSIDYTGKALQKFDPDGKFLTQFALEGELPVLKLAAGRDDFIYLLRSTSLHIFDGRTDTPIRTVRNSNFQDLAANSSGSIYALTDRNEVAKLDENGKVISKTGDLLKQINFEVKDLRRFAVDGIGNIYAADSMGRNLLKFSPDGKFLFRFDSAGAKETAVGILADIAIDNSGKGRVYAANAFKIVIFDTEGAFIGSFTAPQTFGLAVDRNGALWTATRPFIVKYEAAQK